jgi:hypothetical protein
VSGAELLAYYYLGDFDGVDSVEMCVFPEKTFLFFSFTDERFY